MKVCFETFGCRLSKAEALQQEADYLARGWSVTDSHAEADLFVVRGCSVTSRAQYECERLIAHLRRHYPLAPVRVEGCLEQRLQADATEEPAVSDAIPMRTARAYLKVQDGCSGGCTFCIVPRFRGRSRSADFTETLDRARRFIDAGYREIVLTGCNLSLYASRGHRLPELVAALAELGRQHGAKPTDLPQCRFRLGSLEPGPCALETVHAVCENPNVCRSFHLPVQSGSDRLLAAMKRPYVTRDIVDLVRAIRKAMPAAGLGCDLMTGFPGESELDLTATRSLVRVLRFNNAHVFPYSERPGTAAAKLPNQVNQRLRSERAHKLSHDAKILREAFAKSFVGQTVTLAVEHKDKCSGWTEEYLKCEAAGKADRRSLVRVFVTRVSGDRLFGRRA